MINIYSFKNILYLLASIKYFQEFNGKTHTKRNIAKF